MRAGGGALVALLLAACADVAVAPTPPASMAAGTPTATPSAATGPTMTATPRPSPAETDLASSIDRDALAAHLEELQRIADELGGNRATGSPGFDASVRYVSGVLADAGYRVHIQAFRVGTTSSVNVLAEAPGERDGVVVVGAHLDSVAAGPGINDNGSGVAALLELARALPEVAAPWRTVRIAFWGAEEGGPFGSAAYLAGISGAGRDGIVAYLNLDMVASPNAVAFVYAEADAAAGSERITAAFAGALDREGLAWEPIDLEGDSDHGPFVGAGIPTGGLFSGGIEAVTDEQAQRSGSAVAGQPADPCSHRACDTIDNVDLETLTQLARTIARVVAGLASGETGT